MLKLSKGRKGRVKARLVLRDGSSFNGYSFGAELSSSGEVVFNTGMSGYVESLSDPSYKGQILVLTYPLIGNYGVPPPEREQGILKWFESEHIHLAGLAVSDYSEEYSHHDAKESLAEWLRREGVPAITGIDTRMLTRKLREKGVMAGKIVIGKDVPFRELDKENLVAMVSTEEVVEYKPLKRKHARVCLIDCGVKNNIIRELLRRGVEVVRVPWDYDASGVRADGYLISNGPGNPEVCRPTINQADKIMREGKPLFGICLGHQIMALAAGGSTYKLKYGHRGQNQPCIDNRGKAFITSQNHGYAVKQDTLSDEWTSWFTNLNDGTNEGIINRKKPFMAVQFHPEASPGPLDTSFIFDIFTKVIKNGKKD